MYLVLDMCFVHDMTILRGENMTDKNSINEKELEKVNGGFDSPELPEREDRNKRPGISEDTGWMPEDAGWSKEIPEFNKPGTYELYHALVNKGDKED